MPGSDRKVVQQLVSHKEELAELVTDIHLDGQPERYRNNSEEGREKFYEDTISLLNYLEQAVRVDSKKLFNNYLRWARTMLRERDFLQSDLVENVHLLRDAIEKKLPEEEAAILLNYINDGLSSLQSSDPEDISFLHEGDPMYDEARQYLDLLLSGKRKEASQLIQELVEDGTSIRDIYEHIFQRTQYEVGALWQKNEITVAHEHYCTAATQLIMSQLYPKIFAMEKSDKRLVACSVADELHEIGIRMVTDFFEMEGWDTHYLGANMPDNHLIESIKDNNADVLAISVTIPLHISRAKNLITKIREEGELENLKIMVGGYPFKVVPDLWKKVGADASVGSAYDAIEIANNLIQN